MLRNADEKILCEFADSIARKRIAWFEKNYHCESLERRNPLETAYAVLLQKLGIEPEKAPITERMPNRLIFESRNFCPTLEACRILKLDTRFICKHLTEKPTNVLVQRVDPRLRFGRDYRSLRPYGEYCRETISLED
jgi:hypothetical protein